VAAVEGFVEVRAGRAIGWIASELAELGLDPFWGPIEPLPLAKGRGGVGRLVVAGRELVVRPYRRGGALGSLLKDRYTGPSRAKNELEVLARLRAEGVPVVVPVAAVAQKHHAFWRLRLCTELLAEALPLPAFLAAHPELRRYTAEAVGIVVRLAFAAGLRHADLHLDNVLCAVRGDRVRAVLGYSFRMVELAEEVNTAAPVYVAQRISEELNQRALAVNGARVLLLGVTYKPDVADLRETPAEPLAARLLQQGAALSFHDPLVHTWTVAGRQLSSVSDPYLAAAEADLVVLVQAHSDYDLAKLQNTGAHIFDTRGVLPVSGTTSRL